ncbi:hypothetical protein R6Q57_013245 [Mikania cordata]
MINMQYREKKGKGLGYQECEPPFNHNYSIMPKINTSVDDLLLNSDRRFDFSTDFDKPVSLTADPIETSPNISDDFKIYADSLIKTGVTEKNEERSAGRSTDFSTSFGTSSFISKTDFVGKVDKSKITANEMSKNFKLTFVKKNVILETVSSRLHHEHKGHSTVTEEAGSKLNPNCEPFMANLRFVSDHNMTAFLGDPPEKHSEFRSMVDGLILSPVNYAIMEHPSIVTDFIRGFWSTIEEHTDSLGTLSIVGKVQGQPIVITEQILQECLQFGDKADNPVELDQELVNRTVYQIGHEGAYPPTEKKLLHPYWRYLAHVVTQCLSGRKGGYDVLNQTLNSCLVALALGVDFNFSKMIFLDMHANIKGRRKERFLAFPRFLHIVINKRHSSLTPTLGTLEIRRMRDDIFGYMKMNKRRKKQFTGERPLIMFGRFVGEKNVVEGQGTPVAFIAEEHDTSMDTQTGTSGKEHLSETSSSSSEDFVAEKPPPSREEREETQDVDYTPTPESSPKRKRQKTMSKRTRDPRL